MRLLPGDDPWLARLPSPPEGGRRWAFRLADGRALVLVSEEIGAEEQVVLTLHAADGRALARHRRGLVLGGGFVEAVEPIGDRALRFEFPAGVAWRAEVRPRPGWLAPFGLGPLVLRRQAA